MQHGEPVEVVHGKGTQHEALGRQGRPSHAARLRALTEPSAGSLARDCAPQIASWRSSTTGRRSLIWPAAMGWPRQTVQEWLERYAAARLRGLAD
jgi:hypothetical protein